MNCGCVFDSRHNGVRTRPLSFKQVMDPGGRARERDDARGKVLSPQVAS